MKMTPKLLIVIIISMTSLITLVQAKHFKVPSKSQFANTPPNDTSELIMIRIYESYNSMSGGKSEIQIINGETVESIEISVKREIRNKEIYQALKKYLDSGFQILNSSTTSVGVIAITTYIIEKK